MPLNQQDPDDDGKACKMHDKLVSSGAKTGVYNAYLSFLPLQVAIVSALIVQKMFTEEYTVESCQSFMSLFNDTIRRPYYDCTYKAEAQTSQEVADHCNKNASTYDFENFNIDCTQYYFEMSKLFEGIVISYSAHLLLSKIIIYFIRFLHFLIRRMESDGSCCARIMAFLLFFLIFMIPVLLLITLLVLIALRQYEPMRAKIDGQLHSDRQRNLVLYTILMSAPSWVCAMTTIVCQTRFSEKHKSCLINVSDEPPSPSSSITNDTQDGQASWCCSGRCRSLRHDQPSLRFRFCCQSSTKDESPLLMQEMSNRNGSITVNSSK